MTQIETLNGRATGVYATKGRRSKNEDFFPADFVLANTTPWDLETLLEDATPNALHRENANRADGFGAFVLHLGLDDSKLPADFALHHQFLMDIDGPLGEGRSIFLSLSPTWDDTRAPDGMRAATVTTHTRVRPWWDLLERDPDTYYERKTAYTRTMIANINRYVPGFRDAVAMTLPGSPVTYNFYTKRHLGMVGGFPARSLFLTRGPRTGIENLRLVGDSIFPGQSTAGVSLGGIRVADDVRRNMPVGNRTFNVQKTPEVTA